MANLSQTSEVATTIEIGWKTVRELVTETPAAARIFEDLGINYCCGGERSLVDACADAKVRVEDVMAVLAKPTLVSVDCDWRDAPLGNLFNSQWTSTIPLHARESND